MKKPDDAELLAWLDGELAPERRAEIQTQLETDWELRTTLAQLERRIGKYVEATAYQSPVEIEPFDDFWQQLSPQLNTLTATPAAAPRTSPILARIRQWLGAEPYRVRLASATLFVLFLTTGLLSYLSFSPRVYTVSAEELLQRAIRGENERVKQLTEPVIYHKLQVRRVGTSAASVMWESWHNTERNEFRQRVAEPSGLRSPQADELSLLTELTAILQANHLDTQHPLSARAFADWRTHITSRSDKITEIALPHNEAGLQLTTGAAAPFVINTIIAAELTVRKSDWHPIALLLRVQGESGDRSYELREASFEVMPLEALASFATATPTTTASIVPTSTPAPTAIIAAPSPTTSLPTIAALQEAEVAVLYALHQAQADLGEQLEVVREDNKQIVVRGLVQTAKRKEELSQMLYRIPLVNAQILTVEEALQQAQRTAAPPSNASVIATSETAVTSAAATPTVNAFQQRLIEQLGGRKGMSEAERDAVNARVTQFYNSVEADASAAMAEAWALRRLHERFAATSAAALDAASRHRLDEMLGNHTTRLQQRVRSLQARLRPQLMALANDVPSIPSAAEATRPAKIQAAFRAVEQVRALTDQLIAGQSATPLSQTARALLTAFARLDAALSDLEKN